MTTEGIEAVFLETHNWGKSAKFFQGLGYEIEFATDHNSGQLRRGDSPYLFIAEIPETEPTRDDSTARPRDDVRADLRHAPFGEVGEPLVERPRHRKLEHGVAEELEPLIGQRPVCRP